MSNTFSFNRLALVLLAMTRCTFCNGPAVVSLGTAANFTILAKAGVSTVPNSLIVGDVGASPIAATGLTGFSLSLDPSLKFATSSQVLGKLYAADFGPPALTVATLDSQAGFVDATTRPNPDFVELGAGIIGGLTLKPGIYKWSSVVTAPTSITLSGGKKATWIFQIAGTFTMDPQTNIILTGGALARNIVWVVSGAVTIGVGAHFEGVLLAATSVTLNTGATMNGRIFAQTAVALQMATVVAPK